MATIYRKTARGQHEVETRALKLAPRFRGLLILIDGKRSDDELRKLMPQADENALEALAAGGFIEAIAVTADPRPPRAPAPSDPAPAAAAVPVLDLQQRRRQAARVLTDVIGPFAAEAPSLRIERARSIEELRVALEAAIRIIDDIRGHAAAADYAQRFMPE